MGPARKAVDVGQAWGRRMTTPVPIHHAARSLPSMEPRHRIGTAARQTGVSASALRLWERQGLLAPSRSSSGYRLYSDIDLSRLRDIQRMRDQRLNAQGILRLLAPHRRGAASAAGSLSGDRLRVLRHERGYS